MVISRAFGGHLAHKLPYCSRVTRNDSWRDWRSFPGWLLVLLIGLVAWVAIVAAEMATRVTTLYPSVIILGSFLIPVVFLIWAFERQEALGEIREGAPTAVSPGRLAVAFGTSGVLGVAAAAIIEVALLAKHPVIFYGGVAVVEEAIKLVVLLLMAGGLPRFATRDGMVLGAAVGFGFAAFESSGYAFNTVIGNPTADLSLLVQTEATRALLAPVGHGLWTALIGGAIFTAAARLGRLRFSWGIVGWFLVAVCLHASWDLSAPVASVIAQLLTGEPATLDAFVTGRLSNATPAESRIRAIVYWAILVICAVVGLLLARLQWHDRPAKLRLAQTGLDNRGTTKRDPRRAG